MTISHAVARTAEPLRPKRYPGWLRQAAQEPTLILFGLTALVTVFLVLYPLFWLFYGSFAYGDQGLTEVLSRIWSLPGLRRAFINTIWLMVWTVPLSFMFALPLVWITSRTDTPLKGLINLAAILPFLTPPLIGAVAWSLLGAPRTGLVNVMARELGATGPIINIYTMPGLVFVMALYLSPYVFLTVKAFMERMDASLEEASLITGASMGSTIRRVLIPISMPAILSAGILVFTRAMEEFAIPGVLGAPSGIYTITTFIYYQAISYMPPRYEVAAVLASALMAATALCLGLQSWALGGGKRFTTISGKGQAPRLMRLGRWRYVTLAYALIYILLAVGIPYLVLIYAALIKAWGRAPTWDNLTLSNIGATFDPALTVLPGLTNSIILAVSGATIATLLALVVSYIVNKGPNWSRGPLDFITSIPLMMPGPVIAVAMLWAYLRPPLLLYGTLWILLFSYVTHYLPYGVRTITGSFRQINIDLERGAAICGANHLARFWNILFPLVMPGILAGWMLMFVSMLRELSSSVFLFVPGTETAAVALLAMWQEARFSSVAVLSLTLILISVVVVAAVQRIAGTSYLAATAK
jgi:iron(III) transport system permease protein